MKEIYTIIATFVFILQSSYGFNYYNPLFCNNRWIPINKDEQYGFYQHMEEVNKKIPKEKNGKKKNIKKFDNNETIDFNQAGEISILE